MVFRERIRFGEENAFRETGIVPGWGRAEHMEMTVPLKELRKYPGAKKANKNNVWSEKMSRTKKANIWIIVISAALLCVAAPAGRYVYVTEYKITDIGSSVSPGGEYEIWYQNVGEPDFPFGQAHARLVLRQGRKTVAKQSFDVANDGGMPTDEQWDVQWKVDRAEVTVSGEEQPDHLYVLYFDGSAVSEEPETE